MKRVVIDRGLPRVEESAEPGVEPGRVLVDVAWSMISPGTELDWLDNTPRGLWWRVRHRSDGAARAFRRLRSEGMARTFSFYREHGAAPRPLGYSCAGVVREVGEGVEGLEAGMRVACVGAGYAVHAEVVSVPCNLVVPLPAGVSLRNASSVALGGIAVQALRRADTRLGESVVVIGLGLVGQLVARVFHAAGARVIGVDPLADRVERASGFLAHGVVSSADDAVERVATWTGEAGIDVAVVATGKVAGVVQAATRMVRLHGRVVLVGAAAPEMDIDPAWVKEIDLVVSRSFGPGYDEPEYEHGLEYPAGYVRWTLRRNLEAYLQLLEDGRLEAGLLVDREVGLADAAEAYAALRHAKPTPIGVLLRYPAAERFDG